MVHPVAMHKAPYQYYYILSTIDEYKQPQFSNCDCCSLNVYHCCEHFLQYNDQSRSYNKYSINLGCM